VRKVVLLGPQRLQPTVGEVVTSLGLEGPVGVITAGWQEREAEDEELALALGRPVVNLGLYARADEVMKSDQALARAHRERQDRLKGLQELYRIRLDGTLKVARDLLRRHGHPAVIEDERADAIQAIRQLDDHHVESVLEIHQEYDEIVRPLKRRVVHTHREELEKILGGVSALAVAGGHVLVLLNRLRIFGLKDLLPPELPVLAWSAGAMILTERVVLFHDSPPQGAGNAEVLEAGCAIVPEVVALPHARRRLRLDDPVRVGLFARRFAPADSLVMDEGARLDLNPDGSRWLNDRVRRLGTDGSVAEAAA